MSTDSSFLTTESIEFFYRKRYNRKDEKTLSEERNENFSGGVSP